MMNESLDHKISDHTISAQTPAEAAQATVRAYAVTPAAVVNYVSRGYLLVLGNTTNIESIFDDLPPGLPTSVVLTDSCSPELSKKFADRGISVLDSVADVEIKGYLGAFRISASTHDRTTRIDRCFDVPEPGFDLVLDLLEPAVAQQAIPPVGYFAVGGKPRDCNKAVAQLPDWIGEFDKLNISTTQKPSARTARKVLKAAASASISVTPRRSARTTFNCESTPICARAAATARPCAHQAPSVTSTRSAATTLIESG